MQCCINNVAGLFNGPNQCAAICLAAASFVLGILFTCISCRIIRACGKKSCCKNEKKQDRPFEKRKPHPAPADGSTEIYVGNLSYDMTEDQLRKEFEAFGKVNSARIITNRYNNKSKGFGFVHMPVKADARRACEALNDKEICGRKMKCNEAKNLI